MADIAHAVVKVKFDTERLGRMVKACRDTNRLSLRDVEQITGISASTLSRIEKGYTPDIETFGQLCEFLRANPEQFFYVD